MIKPALGLLLAGGRSTRMGGDKAFVEIGGEPLWRRQLQTLQTLGTGRIIASRQSDQAPLPGLESFADEVEGFGPIAGLRAALARCSAGHLAVLAIDLPGVDARWFQPLLEASVEGRGAVYRDGRNVEPLAAIYPAEARPVLDRRIAEGQYSLQGLCAELEKVSALAVIDLPDALRGAAANLNTPTDLARWAV